MGMTIDEIIAKEQEMSEIFQKIVDTQMVSEDLSLDEIYCGDTEIIEEELKRYQELADFHSQIVDTLRKYQKIMEILNSTSYVENGTVYSYTFLYDEDTRVKHIREVIDGSNS